MGEAKEFNRQQIGGVSAQDSDLGARLMTLNSLNSLNLKGIECRHS